MKRRICPFCGTPQQWDLWRGCRCDHYVGPSASIKLRKHLPAMKKQRSESACLNDPGRLGDVVAAIQAMGTYKFYKLPFDGWADRISGDSSKGDHWKTVFLEHPEFFRFDSKREKASLVWRRQYPKRFQ